MKSVTESMRMRSARFPNAPPASSPIATHIPGRSALRAKRAPISPRANRVRASRSGRSRRREAEGDAVVVDIGEVEEGEHLDVLAGHELRLDAALLAWSTATTAPARASARRQDRAPGPARLTG